MKCYALNLSIQKRKKTMQTLTFNELPSAVMELNRKMDALLSQLPLKNEPEQDDPLFTIEQLCDWLPEKPKRQTVYGWITYRLIPYQKYGKRLYFRRSDIQKWLNDGRRMQTN
jgi:hypothetical protein